MKKTILLGLILGWVSVAHSTPNFWENYYRQADREIEENFWGNLITFQKAERVYRDPYIAQMRAMGYEFSEPQPAYPGFEKIIQWCHRSIDELIAQGKLKEHDAIRPGKAFQVGDMVVFLPFGGSVPAGAEPLNLLTPDVFVAMLAQGYFPISEPIREHTNQTLAEHDVAHVAGFISNPRYMKAVRQAFAEIQQRAEANPRLRKALENFDSAYSLRLYYMIEVFTEIPEHQRSQLAETLEWPQNKFPHREEVEAFLLAKAQDPVKFARYLSNIYRHFHGFVNPLGGESRDILNRSRKWKRGDTSGGFFDKVSSLSSKFYGNSLYDILLRGKAALEHRRSSHDDYIQTIKDVHTVAIAALIGTSQLSVEDWVLACVPEVPDPNSRLYRYIHDSGLWDENHLLFLAYTGANYDADLSER